MSKASLETLARTMSVAFLAVTVVIVGMAQVLPANAGVLQAKCVEIPGLKKALAIKMNTKEARANRAMRSARSAPKDVRERGIWLKHLLKKAGFRGKSLKVAWAVAMKESTGRPMAHTDNPASGDNSYGIFQINMIGGMGPERRAKFDLKSNIELLDPLRNAEIAYYMTNHGKDWSSWDINASGYNGGVSKSRYQYWLTKYPKG